MTRTSSTRLTLLASVIVFLLATGSLVAADPPAEPWAIEGGQLVLAEQREPNTARMLTAGNIAPGWSGSADIDVANPGASGATLRFSLVNVVNEDFECSDPETNCQGGQLGDGLLLTLKEGDSTVWRGPASVEALADAGSLDLGGLNAGASRRFQLSAELPMSAGNDVMTDRVAFDIVFSLEATDPPPAPPTTTPDQPTSRPSVDSTPTYSTIEVLAAPPPVVDVLAPTLPRTGGLPILPAALFLTAAGLMGLGLRLRGESDR